MDAIGIALVASAIAIFLLIVVVTRSSPTARSSRSRSLHDRELRRKINDDTESMKRVEDLASTESYADKTIEELKHIAAVCHDGVDDVFSSRGALVLGRDAAPDKALRAYEELVRRGDHSRLKQHILLLQWGVPGHEHVIDRVRAAEIERIMDGLGPGVGGPMSDGIAVRYGYEVSASASFSQTPWSGPTLSAPAVTTTAAPAVTTTAPPAATTTLPAANSKSSVRRTHGEDAWIGVVPVVAAGPVVADDKHNAHDSGVTKTVAASIKAILARAGDDVDVDVHTALRRLRDHVSASDASEDRKRNAVEALNAIERNDHPVSATDNLMTESELIATVWTRIHAADNAQNADALRSNLVMELSEMIQHGKPVCTSGRITRIVGALDGVDDAVRIKPKWALQKEMVDKAGALYAKKVAALDAREAADIEALNPTPEQQVAYDGFLRGVKDEIRAEFTRAYVDDKVMTADELEAEMSKWIDHL